MEENVTFYSKTAKIYFPFFYLYIMPTYFRILFDFNFYFLFLSKKVKTKKNIQIMAEK